MRLAGVIGIVLLVSVGGFAQTAAAVYEQGNTVVDNAGNLVVFDFGRSTTGVTVTGYRHSVYAPKTRVTIQRAGSSAVQTVEYDGALQVIGAGDSAVYAIATSYTISSTSITAAQSLIAIRPSQSLPAALSGFPSLALTSQVDARVGSSDYISLVTFGTRATSSTAATPRTARVVHFVAAGSSGSFETTSSGTLP